MHLDTLSNEQKKLLKTLSPAVAEFSFILAGGTAVSLLLGHTRSEDFDFFTSKRIRINQLFNKLIELALDISIVEEDKESLVVFLNSIKTSFFSVPFNLKPERYVEGIPVANLEDIAAMKLLAISQRGAKRDFVDLYFILQEKPFHIVARAFLNLYGKERAEPIHIAKSLAYFKDAEPDPEPVYMKGFEVSWDSIKHFFKKHIKDFIYSFSSEIGA